jgi:uncharacterized protein
MPINAGYEYFDAEKRYLAAQTTEEKISTLRELIKAAPKHKGSENLLSELKTRLRKLLEKKEKAAATGKGKKGIRKEGFQVVLVGLPNSGKSSVLARLTNATPVISNTPFSTYEPGLGTMHYEGVSAQIVDLPAVGSKNFDVGLVHTADCVLVIVSTLFELTQLEPVLASAHGARILVVTKVDLLDETSLRKLDAQLKSKRFDYVLFSSTTSEGVRLLKEKIFGHMHVIRVYMKEPGKPASPQPMVLAEGSTVFKVAEAIYKGYSRQIKETRLTGPSGKFSNQRVGLDHVLKDKDTLEFHTR